MSVLLLPSGGLPSFFKKRTEMFYDTTCRYCKVALPKHTEAYFCITPSGAQYLCEKCSKERDFSFEITPEMAWHLACECGSLKTANKALMSDLSKAMSWIKHLTGISEYYQVYEELQSWYEWEEEPYEDSEEDT